MFRDDFGFARVQTQIPDTDQSLDARAPMRGILETSLHSPLAHRSVFWSSQGEAVVGSKGAAS
jgi:hypothetical protein